MKHLNPLNPLHCGPDEPEMGFKLMLRAEYKTELYTLHLGVRSGASRLGSGRGMKLKITWTH